MPLHFTKSDLKERAGTEVFNRGVTYFQNGFVGEIKIIVDKYMAKVHGRNVYNVAYSPEEDAFSCNCSYNGFCKHEVALGLKLLREKERLSPTIKFHDWYYGISDEIKIRFLERLIRNDFALKEKLDRMNRQSGDDESVNISDIANAVYNTLNVLAYDDVLENYDGYNYYVDEYEVIDDLVSGTLADYLTAIREYIQMNKPFQAFDHLLGTYLGLQKSNDTEIAEYVDDFENYLFEPISEFVQFLQKQSDGIKSKIFNRFIEFCNNNPVHSLIFFKDFLLLFIKEHSDRLKKFLLAFPDDYTAKGILLTILEREQDMEMMKRLLKENDSVYLYVPYLNLLKVKGEYKEIKQILLKFLDGHDICILKQFIIPELGNETYKKLLHQLILQCFELKYYKIYQKLISEDEKQAFLSGIGENISFSTERYALPILSYEKIYKPILKYIENSAESDFGFNSCEPYLKKIARSLPAEVWDIYHKRTDFLLKQRKRKDYATMAYYLKTMKGINKDKTDKLITTYYNHTPALRALRDEFKKARII